MESPLSFKILLIGGHDVGRDTLLRATFQLSPFNLDYKHVVGAGFFTKRVDIEGRTVILQIWNIATEERFRYVLPSFIVGAVGTLLMFDITNSHSFAFLSDFPQMIREIAGEIPILLVGNKVDSEEERAVSREEGIAFARNNNLFSYIEISAKTGKNCEGILELLAKNIMTQLQLH